MHPLPPFLRTSPSLHPSPPFSSDISVVAGVPGSVKTLATTGADGHLVIWDCKVGGCICVEAYTPGNSCCVLLPD